MCASDEEPFVLPPKRNQNVQNSLLYMHETSREGPLINMPFKVILWI